MPPEAIPPRDEGILGQGIAEITENTVESEGRTQPNLMMLTVEGEAQGLPTERAEGITGKEKDEEVQNLAGEIKGKKQGVEEKKTLVDNVVLLDEQSTQTQEKCDKNSNVLKTESSRTKEVMDQEETMNEGDRGWSTPIKVVRSPVKSTELRYGEVSIMSNSFSCLSDKGEA